MAKDRHSKFKTGQSIVVKINGVPQEAVVKSVLDQADGLKIIVDFGNEQVAMVSERDVLET